jgi:hypothetical protein
MNHSLEQSRDTWINAYYLGQVDTLKTYEHDNFIVIFQKSGITETHINRYDRILHAVQNGVWKPQKPDIEIEEFEYDYANTFCQVLMKSADEKTLIQELWKFENGWKILELKL